MQIVLNLCAYQGPCYLSRCAYGNVWASVSVCVCVCMCVGVCLSSLSVKAKGRLVAQVSKLPMQTKSILGTWVLYVAEIGVSWQSKLAVNKSRCCQCMEKTGTAALLLKCHSQTTRQAEAATLTLWQLQLQLQTDHWGLGWQTVMFQLLIEQYENVQKHVYMYIHIVYLHKMVEN